MKNSPELPVPVLDFPHWRVNIRPGVYDPRAIPSLRECLRIVEKNAVSLRGWNYPHISHRTDEQARGNSWVGSWADFGGHYEYWRFYQSAQFVHLFAVRESTEPNWRQKLQREMESHLSYRTDINWDEVPGFIDIINTLYCVSEIVEFAARLAQSGVYTDGIEVTIELHCVEGFVLAAPWQRSWSNYYAASEETVGRTWELVVRDLLADSVQVTLDILVWLFERFGWMDPPHEVLRQDIEDYRSGNR